jgi:D-alanyl-D-alanine-carboxypeptidase/D-alanyl-D-alanine-endopeptidase
MKPFLSSMFLLIFHLTLAQSVQEKIRQRVDYLETPGIVVGIYDQGRTTYHTFGVANRQSGEPVTSTTLFEIGSITKVFTSGMAAILSGDSKIKMSEKAQSYLPEKMMLPEKNGIQIKVEHLAMAHSGLPRMPLNFRPADPENPYVDYSEDQLIEFINTYELSREPGAQYEYSNLGMGLLGYLLTNVSNKPYSKVVAELILEPLKMQNTFVSGDRTDKLLATGHSGNQPVKSWTWSSESVLTGAGGLVSNAEDMMKFMIANLQASKTSTPLAKAFALTHVPRGEAGTMKIGYGWHIRDEKIVWHNGGTGGFRSFAGFNKATNKAVVVLTNSNTGADDLGFHLLDEIYELKALKKPFAVSIEQLQKYIGTYELMPGFNMTITLEDGQLAAQATGQPKTTIYAESETRFHYKVVNAQIEFVLNNGDAEKLILYQNNAELTGKKIH